MRWERGDAAEAMKGSEVVICDWYDAVHRSNPLCLASRRLAREKRREAEMFFEGGWGRVWAWARQLPSPHYITASESH